MSSIVPRETYERLDAEEQQDLKSLFDKIAREDPREFQRIAEDARQRLGSLPSENVLTRDVQRSMASIEAGARQYDWKLGSTPLPNEFRLHRHGTFDLRVEPRQVEADVFVRFTHPSLSEFLDHAISCAAASGVASVVVGVASGALPAAYATFYPAWRLCMVASVGLTVAQDFGVELYMNKRTSCWENHC